VAGLGSQITEHGLRVLVAAFNRRASEADERCLGQRIAYALGEAVNEIVLVAARFIRDKHDVLPRAQLGHRRALLRHKQANERGVHAP